MRTMLKFVVALMLGVSASGFASTRGGLRLGRTLRMATTLSDFSATTLSGEDKPLSDYKGKVVLIENVATLWGTTVADFNAINGLVEKYGDKGLSVIGFPCNQFGHQTNEGNDEILNTLKYVRPGGGFEPKCDMMSKVNVNGEDADPLFKWMRSEIKIPQDGPGDTKGNSCDNVDALVLPRGGFGGSTVVLWTPVSRSDIAWNFEKFLLNKDGELVKRYSRYYPTDAIGADIEALL